MGDDCCRFVYIFYGFKDNRWILDEFMTEFGFSGRMSRVHFVVNLLLVTVAVVACLMRRIWTGFLSLPVDLSRSVLMLTLSFSMFFNVTGSEFCLCGLFFVELDAVTLVTNDMFSLGVLELLVFVAHGLMLGAHHDDFGWLLEGGGGFGGIHDCVCIAGILKSYLFCFLLVHM